MNEKVRKYIVFSLLPVAVIWAYFNIGDRTKDAEEKNDYNESIVENNDMAENYSPTFDREKYSLKPWGRDPFARKSGTGQAPTMTNPTEAAWNLSGILINNYDACAVINEKLVRSGDKVDGATVESIGKDMVTINKDGRIIRLKIAKDKS
jgi:hypothetical protein